MYKIISLKYQFFNDIENRKSVVSKGDSEVLSVSFDEINKNPEAAKWKIAKATGADIEERAKIKAEKAYAKELKKQERKRERDLERAERKQKRKGTVNKWQWRIFLFGLVVTFPVWAPLDYARSKVRGY